MYEEEFDEEYVDEEPDEEINEKIYEDNEEMDAKNLDWEEVDSEESYKEKVMEEDVIKVVVKEVVMEDDKEEQLQENTHKRCLPWPSISMVQRRGHRLCRRVKSISYTKIKYICKPATGLMGVGVASIFATGFLWTEQRITITSKVSWDLFHYLL